MEGVGVAVDELSGWVAVADCPAGEVGVRLGSETFGCKTTVGVTETRRESVGAVVAEAKAVGGTLVTPPPVGEATGGGTEIRDSSVALAGEVPARMLRLDVGVTAGFLPHPTKKTNITMI
jgi:hypothetical protein